MIIFLSLFVNGGKGGPVCYCDSRASAVFGVFPLKCLVEMLLKVGTHDGNILRERSRGTIHFV